MNKKVIKGIIICLLLLISLLYVLYERSRYTLEGWVEITEKAQVNDAYYIFFKDNEITIRVKCSGEDYATVKTDGSMFYYIKCTYSTLFPENGKLLAIDTTEYIKR